jgi:Putative transposase
VRFRTAARFDSSVEHQTLQIPGVFCRNVAAWKRYGVGKRTSRRVDGRIRYTLKTPYRDGTTQVLFEPLDFLARLAALVPSPGANLTRYHGVFAPNHGLRAQIVPAKRGRGAADTARQGSATAKHVSMRWAQRLKRVFGIEINACEHCGGAIKIIVSIEDPRRWIRINTQISGFRFRERYAGSILNLTLFAMNWRKSLNSCHMRI